MPKEIERKFLINRSKISLPAAGKRIRQGYLPAANDSKTVVRVRVVDDQAYLTIKGENTGPIRSEYEYPIPPDHGEEILNGLCRRPLIEKTRYELVIENHTWEIDVFEGDNVGLIIAEIELETEDEDFIRPDWITREVTDDPKYYNSNLISRPFTSWDKATGSA